MGPVFGKFDKFMKSISDNQIQMKIKRRKHYDTEGEQQDVDMDNFGEY